MGTNMSNPSRGGLTEPPERDSPTKDENSQNLSNSLSTKPINAEDSTCLSSSPVEHYETPEHSSYCESSQVNLLISLRKNEAPFVDFTNLFFAGKHPLNTLIDRAKRNGDLVLSFLLPQDFPSSRAKLVHWTQEILKERFPLGIVSILSATQAKDILELIQSTHTHSTPNQPSLWKENSVVFFDCEASWELDPSRVHCVVYKIQHNTHQIAVLRVDEAAKEYKQQFDSDRVKFAKAIIIPLILSLRTLSFKFAETRSEDMENRDAVWWLPIVAERARRAREQKADLGPDCQAHHTSLQDFRVFGNTSQSWLGGYEANTFQSLSHRSRQRDTPVSHNTASSVVNTTADTSSTLQANDKPGSSRASKKAAKKKEKKKARKEAKKAEIETSGVQGGDSTIPTESNQPQPSPLHNNTINDLACIDTSGPSFNSSQLIIGGTIRAAQEQASTALFEQIENHSPHNQEYLEHAISLENGAIRNLNPAKESSLSQDPSSTVIPTQDDSSVTSPSIIAYDATIIPGGDTRSEPCAASQIFSPAEQDSIPGNTSSVQADSSTALTTDTSLENTTRSTAEETSESSKKKKNKGKKKGSRKLKDTVNNNTYNSNSTPVLGSAVGKNLSAKSTPAASAPSDPLSQERRTFTESPIRNFSTQLENSSETKQAPIESGSSLNIPKQNPTATKWTDEHSPNLFTESSENQFSTSAGGLSGSQPTSFEKSSKTKPAKISTEKAPIPLRPSLKAPSQSTEASTITHCSFSDSAPKSSSRLGPNPDVKGSNFVSNILPEDNAVDSNSSIKDSIPEGTKPNKESERRVSPEKPPQSSSQGSSSKDQPKGDPAAAEPAENGENKKSSKKKKKNKRSRKARNKDVGSTIPDTDADNETGPANHAPAPLNDNVQSSTSGTMNGNKSGSSLSKTPSDSKLSTTISKVPSNDKPKLESVQGRMVSTSSGTADQASGHKVTHFQGEASSISQVKTDSSIRRPPIPLKTSEKRTSDIPLGKDNQPVMRTLGKPAGEIKRPCRPEPVLKAPNVETAGKTEGPGTVEARKMQSLPNNPRREAPVAGSASGTRSTRTSANAPSPNPRTQGRQASQGFFWQLDSHGFPCAMAGCDKRCNSWDGASVICPKCGPYSEIRYCGKEHLFEDVKFHWLQCGTKTFKHPCRASTIPKEQKEGPPLLPNLHNWDTPERFRQAVRHAADNSGDYFVFRDWQDWMAAGQPANNVAVRCSTRVIYTARFDDPVERDRFRRVQGIALFNPLQFELVGYLFRLIRGNALAKGQWSEELDLALQYQFNLEYGFAVGAWLGARHACETEWTGANIRHCSDAVCRAERAPLLGDRGVGRGFQHLCEYMEASHWLLRAARRTHPSVAAVEERMRGEGFEGVVPGDRRVFRRGEGWDGVGTGEVEIEGVNLF